MSKGQKILASALWGVVVLLMVGLIASWAGLGQRDTPEMAGAGTAAEPPPVTPVIRTGEGDDITLPAFALTDQSGRAFASTGMQGKTWIVDFIFTRCGGPCPMMTARMVALQKQLKDTGVRFLSLSVDPKFDTPEVLTKYAKERGADLSTWTFLTGDEGAIFAASKALLLGVTPANGEAPIMHSTKFVLVDAQGKVHGYYSGTEDESLKELEADARKLGGTKTADAGSSAEHP